MTAEIEVRGLSKAYIIQHDVAAYGVLRDRLGALLTHPLRTLRGRAHESEQIWALRDVTFDVAHGDVLGVIGRNGSGKSTLLKILSRIVAPTEGQAVLRGKVASLLEVGTGFHAELTGRENIYLNGAILGLSRKEIDNRFDQIVEFSEIPKFLDTPVKFYSSGMYVRLAFAVAAHLDPQVLIVDEVLSVGDAGFQKKSLEKMRQIAGEGRTVLFVSHSASSILELCTRGIHLSMGRIVGEGTAVEALESYREELDTAEEEIVKRSRGSMSGATITRVRVKNEAGLTPQVLQPREPLVFEFEALVEPRYRSVPLAAAFGVDSEAGARLLTVISTWVDTVVSASDGHVMVRCEIPQPPLGPGRYVLSASLIADGELINAGGHGPTFEIEQADGVLLDPPRDARHGPVMVDFKFEVGFRHRRETGGHASVSGHPHA